MAVDDPGTPVVGQGWLQDLFKHVLQCRLFFFKFPDPVSLGEGTENHEHHSLPCMFGSGRSFSCWGKRKQR